MGNGNISKDPAGLRLSTAQIRQQVNDVFESRFESDPQRRTPERHLFDELGMDSLDAVDLAIDFQRRWGQCLLAQRIE